MPRYKHQLKHLVKVHIWAGIRWKGSTECIFEEITSAEMYTNLLAQCHSFNLCILRVIVLCKTIKLSTPLVMPTDSFHSLRRISPRALTQIQLSICGIS